MFLTIFGTNYSGSAFVSLIVQICHLRPHLFLFVISSFFHLSHYLLLLHSSIQDSKLTYSTNPLLRRHFILIGLISRTF